MEHTHENWEEKVTNRKKKLTYDRMQKIREGRRPMAPEIVRNYSCSLVR